MKLSDNTIEILKNFSSINGSILFREGNVLKTIAPLKNILASALIDENIEQDFAIYDLSRFLGVLSLFHEPNIELEDKAAVISANGSKLNYVYADPSTFPTPPQKDVKFPDTNINFDLKQEDLQKVMKAGSVLQLPEIAVVGSDGKLSLKAYDQKNPTADYFSKEIGETEEEFIAIFKVGNLKMIPNDYKVSIAKGISRFSSRKVMYFIATEATSKFS